MDLKILIVVVLGTLIFFLAYQCSKDDRPDYDKIQAQKREERTAAFNQKKEAEKQQRKAEQ